MLDIEIAFIYFDETMQERTAVLEEEVQKYMQNYLVNYIFYNNYCIFSDIKLTEKEAKILVSFIESDKGLDLLYGEGIKTEYATYKMYDEQIKEKTKIETIESMNNEFEEKLDNYLTNIRELISIKELQKENSRLQDENEAIANRWLNLDKIKELMKDYKKLLDEKNKKIDELSNSNKQLTMSINSIPKFIRKIFMKKNKLLLEDNKNI